MRKNYIIAVLIILIALLNAAAADLPVSWKQAEAGIKATWAKQYANEKLISVEQNGEAKSYNKVENDVKVYYIDFPAKVTAEQKSGKVIFNVTAIFKKSGNNYNYTGMSVGESTAMANKGQEAPSKDEIKKLVAEYFVKKNPGKKVAKVLISPPEMGKSDKRWWYKFGADVELDDKTTYTNDDVYIFRGQKGSEGLDPSASWNVDAIGDFEEN
jgi:hypothetical protein